MKNRWCRFCRYSGSSECEGCNEKGKKFRPKDDVKDYFEYLFWDKDTSQYRFNTTKEGLDTTTMTKIGHDDICPYCGEKGFHVQGLFHIGISDVTGHTCICEGAMLEREYRKKLEELQKKHKSELRELEKEYRPKLRFDTPKLLERKQNAETKALEKDETNYFTTSGYDFSRVFLGKE